MYLCYEFENETTSAPRYKNITALSTLGVYNHECDGCLQWDVVFRHFMTLTFLNRLLKTRN